MHRPVAESSIAGFTAALYAAYVVPAVASVGAAAVIITWSNFGPRFEFLLGALVLIGMPVVFAVSHWLLMRRHSAWPWRWGICTAAGLFMGLAASGLGGGFMYFFVDALFRQLLPVELSHTRIVSDLAAADISTAILAAGLGGFVLGAMQAFALRVTRGNRLRWIAATVVGVIVAIATAIPLLDFVGRMAQLMPGDTGVDAATAVAAGVAAMIGVLALPFALITGRAFIAIHRSEERIRSAEIVDMFA